MRPGEVSAANLRAIAKAPYDYIVEMRVRRNLDVCEEVLRRAGRCREVEHNLQVKEVWVDERRYIFCFNPERAAKDSQDRQVILNWLDKKVGRGSVNGRIFAAFLALYLSAVASTNSGTASIPTSPRPSPPDRSRPRPAGRGRT